MQVGTCGRRSLKTVRLRAKNTSAAFATPPNKPKRRRPLLGGGELRRRDSKDTFDVREIAYADLDVRFFVEAGCVVDALSFEKHTSNCLKGFPFVALVDGMNMIDHRAVQIPL